MLDITTFLWYNGHRANTQTQKEGLEMVKQNHELLSTCDDFITWVYQWHSIHGKLSSGEWDAPEDTELVSIARRMEHELKRIRKDSHDA